MDEIKVRIAGDKAEDFITFEDKEYGQRYFIRDGASYREVTLPRVKPVFPHTTRRYKLMDTQSFIAAVRRYGNPETGIIFYNEHGITMFFDERSRAERITLNFEPSLELLTFIPEGYKFFTQKEFLKALESFPEGIENSLFVIAEVKKFRMEQIINFESEIEDGYHTFIYKEKEGRQTGKLPKHLKLKIPFFRESKIVMEIWCDLEIKKPKSADDKLLFKIVDPRFEYTKRDALKAEIEMIKSELKDWFFVYGEE